MGDEFRAGLLVGLWLSVGAFYVAVITGLGLGEAYITNVSVAVSTTLVVGLYYAVPKVLDRVSNYVGKEDENV